MRRFLLMSGVSTFLGTFAYSLSTHSVLTKLNQTNNITEISKNYILRDVVGNLSSVFIISKVGKYIDKKPMKFLLVSIALQHFSMSLDCLIPKLDIKWFLPISAISMSASCVSFCGIGALNNKALFLLSKKNNIGECYSKLTAVIVGSSSIGSVLGITFLTNQENIKEKEKIQIITFLGIIRTIMNFSTFSRILTIQKT